jgi:hypothetical protein
MQYLYYMPMDGLPGRSLQTRSQDPDKLGPIADGFAGFNLVRLMLLFPPLSTRLISGWDDQEFYRRATCCGKTGTTQVPLSSTSFEPCE